jgi:hypothetical protein
LWLLLFLAALGFIFFLVALIVARRHARQPRHQ